MRRAPQWLSWIFGLSLALGACAEAPAIEGRSPSLIGTDTDGTLRIDSSGAFVADQGAQWLFDYFLTAEGEMRDEQIRAEVVAEARARLEPSAASRAIELFDAYVAYRREAAEIGRDEDLSLEAAAKRLRDAYARHLGPLQGFSAELERIDQAVTVARLLRDDELDPTQKAARLASVAEGAAEARWAHAPARAHHAVAAARARGASDAEVFDLRAELLGEEAAGRLAALDRERAAWEARVEDYLVEVRALRASLADDEARVEVERLRRERFNDAELLRLRAPPRGGAAAR
jgi:lipase chaperone LimK